MGTALLEKTTEEPLLAGSANERFRQTVQDKPALFYDVVKTGQAVRVGSGSADKNLRREHGFWTADEKVPYEIVILHAGNVSDTTLAQMMALQDKAAKYNYSHPENSIDYKSEEEVIAHYSGGGLGLGIFTAGGELIGQTILSFSQPGTGPFAEQGAQNQANIDWVMIDADYKRNNLCENLIKVAIMMAECGGMEQIRAHVRLHNSRALARFSQQGFVAAGIGENGKDGSQHFKVFRPVSEQPALGKKCDEIILSSLRYEENVAALTNQFNRGGIAKLNGERMTIHGQANKGAQLNVVSLG